MTQIDEFKQNLIATKDKIEPILKGDTDKFIQIASNYVEQNVSLLDKDRPSLYNAIMLAAQSGVYIDGQEAALVPFKGIVKLIIMYKGLLKQVRNSGELSSINCGVVYEHDVFEFFVDENGEHLKHVPKFSGDRGKPSSTYAIARIKDGQAPYIEIITEDEIQDCKNQSRAGNDSPWNGKFADEMRKKTVIRRISKRLPSSTDLNAAIHADDDLFMPPDEEKETPPSLETSSKLRDAIAPQEKEPIDGDYKEGSIDEIKIFNVTRAGKPANRYGCRMGDDWFGTFDQKLYEEMGAAIDKKLTVWLIHEKKEKPNDGGSYNEALRVQIVKTAEDNVPI